jgi:hypothetical protein
LVGTDKFEHFFQQGYWLFDMVYGKARLELLKIDPTIPDFGDLAIRRAFSEWMEGVSPQADPLIAKYEKQFTEVGKHFGCPSFGYFGSDVTGIASWADIQAGLDGYEFYVSLYNAFLSNPNGNPPTFSLKSYNVSKWNEQNNKNWFVHGLKRDDHYDPGVPRHQRHEWERSGHSMWD